MKARSASLYLLIAFAITSIASSGMGAAIALNGIFGFNATSKIGGDLTDNSLVLILVDTGNNGFLLNPISEGSSLTLGSFLSGDDLIVGSFGATNFGNGDLDTLLTGSANFDIDTGAFSAADVGDKFAVLWFDGASSLTTTAAVGQFYGFGSASDWILPSAPSTRTMGTNFTQLGSSGGASAGTASFAVIAVPEPSRALLLLAGVVGLAVRRRR